ncbi:MAG TPA: ABC transporter permease [Conexibacter sp.]|jgi:ribose transport system permease protein
MSAVASSGAGAPAPPIVDIDDKRPAALQRVLALQQRMPLLQLVALVIVSVYGALTVDGLTSSSSIRLILVLAALAGLASVGQTLLILLGGFDLSVSGFIVGGALIVTQVASRFHWSFAEALIIALVGAAILGAIAGQICHRLDVNPLIITLAIGTVAVGLAQTQTPGGLTYGASAPRWLVTLSSSGTDTFGIPVPPLVVIWAVVAILMTIFLSRSVIGARLMATGANRGAADYSLIKTRRIWTVTFAFSAVMSVIVGLFVAGSGGAITNDAGDPYLFQSVIAVIVGGTVFGGPGSYGRTVIGALFLTVLNNVLLGHGASASDQQIIYGVAILVAVGLYSRDRRVRDDI